MNGIALHGGFIPYGGTFLVFADYLKPALRLSALMKQHVIYVLTHDSIGVGEDGPTHQPIEQLAMLRATPNVLVFRPCDALETAESWETALQHKTSPCALILSRQNLPFLRTSARINQTDNAHCDRFRSSFSSGGSTTIKRKTYSCLRYIHALPRIIQYSAEILSRTHSGNSTDSGNRSFIRLRLASICRRRHLHEKLRIFRSRGTVI